MSLLAWYPLNGNTENYGFCDASIGSTKTVEFVDSKMGKGFNSNLNKLAITSNEFSDLSEFTLCFWVYIDLNNTINSWQDVFSIKLKNGVFLRLEKTNATNTFSIFANGALTDSGGAQHFTITPGTWIHFTLVKTSSLLKVYINGEKLSDFNFISKGWTDVLTSNQIALGDTSSMYAKFNDLRFYDNELSEKEIYEISKGLVVHYDFNKKFPGNDNLLKNSMNMSRAKNGGYLEVLDDTLTHPFSEYCKTMKASETDSAKAESMSYIHEDIIGVSEGDTITLSSWFYIEDITKFSQKGGLILRLIGYDSSGSKKYDPTAANISLNISERKWTKITKTFNISGSNSTKFVFSITLTGTGEFWFSEPKVEYGSEATPWSPHESEYANLGIDFRFIEDSSGFGNHGTIASSKPIPRSNNTKSSIGTNCAYLSTSTLTHQRAVSNENQEWTVSAWVQLTDLISNGTNNFSTLNNFNDGLFLSYYGSGISNLLLYLNSGTNDYYNYSNKKLEFDKWHLVTYVFKNSEGIKRIYIDGKDCTNYAGPNKTSTPRGIPESVMVFNSFKGYCADYKEYATALTPDDVRKEYQSKASLDSKYKLFANELCDFGKNIGELANYNLMNGVTFDDYLRARTKTQVESVSNYSHAGLGVYTQSNLSVTKEIGGARIYSPPNKNPTDDKNTMWGGLCWSPMKNNLSSFKKGHRYLLLFHVAGKSSRAMNEIILSDHVGWYTGTTAPKPTTNHIIRHPANFEGEMDCLWDFTIEDDIYKTCTNNGTNKSFTVGEVYLSYAAFKFGYTYQDTGALGTDIIISNLRLFDITDMDLSNILEIQENSTVNCLDLVEGHTNSYQTSDYTVLQMNEIMER